MLVTSAVKLLSKYAPVEQIGQHQHRIILNGYYIDCLSWDDGQTVSRVIVQKLVGENTFENAYFGTSIREALRVALGRQRQVEVEIGKTKHILKASITHGSVALTPDLSFSLNGVLVSTLQNHEALGMANGFIDGGDPRPLLDWLMERSEAIAREVEKMNRIAGNLSG